VSLLLHGPGQALLAGFRDHLVGACWGEPPTGHWLWGLVAPSRGDTPMDVDVLRVRPSAFHPHGVIERATPHSAFRFGMTGSRRRGHGRRIDRPMLSRGRQHIRPARG